MVARGGEGRGGEEGGRGRPATVWWDRVSVTLAWPGGAGDLEEGAVRRPTGGGLSEDRARDVRVGRAYHSLGCCHV
jgi:hypothetical protein